MQIQSTGGIFLRLDSSGNLNVYDTTGTSIAIFKSGVYSSKQNILTTRLASAFTTTSTTSVSTGMGGTLTLNSTGRFLVLSENFVSSSVAADTANVGIYINQTGVPASGVTTGTDAVLPVGGRVVTLTAANVNYPFGEPVFGSGQPTATALFFYLGIFRASGTGTLTVPISQGLSVLEV